MFRTLTGHVKKASAPKPQTDKAVQTAIEIGFFKAAADMGLNKAQTDALYRAGVAKLTQR